MFKKKTKGKEKSAQANAIGINEGRPVDRRVPTCVRTEDIETE
jgi:hypothetical protein